MDMCLAAAPAACQLLRNPTTPLCLRSRVVAVSLVQQLRNYLERALDNRRA